MSRSNRALRVAWAALVLLAFGDALSELVPGTERAAEGEARLLARLRYEQRYAAGWLTRRLREAGALPMRMPLNRGARGDGSLVPLCPSSPAELTGATADWALCAQDGGVRAFARDPALQPGTGLPEPVELFPR